MTKSSEKPIQKSTSSVNKQPPTGKKTARDQGYEDFKQNKSFARGLNEYKAKQHKTLKESDLEDYKCGYRKAGIEKRLSYLQLLIDNVNDAFYMQSLLDELKLLCRKYGDES